MERYIFKAHQTYTFFQIKSCFHAFNLLFLNAYMALVIPSVHGLKSRVYNKYSFFYTEMRDTINMHFLLSRLAQKSDIN
jgi:hypothetical protein